MWTISADFFFLVLFSKEIDLHTIIREILETEIEDTGYILFLVHTPDSMNSSNKYLLIAVKKKHHLPMALENCPNENTMGTDCYRNIQ